MMHIGLDLGGTKIAGAALDMQGQEMALRRTATPQNYNDIIRSCAQMVQDIAVPLKQPFTVGVCTPGAVDSHAGMVKFSPNVPALKDKNFVADLSNACGAPVHIANDAACFTLSEAVDGAAKDARVVYGVILGTGVGGAMVVDKKAPLGANHVMEWGHTDLPWQTANDVRQKCGCGRMGDIESYLSGSALMRQIKEKTGRDYSVQEFHEAIAAEHPLIKIVMMNYVERLAKAFSMLINIMDMDMIVVGGGVSNIPLLFKELPRFMPDYVLASPIKTRIVKAHFGDDSGWRGAARLWV
jgi:fructokinase